MRIRTIKPEFWSSLTLATLPRDVRLTFIGLWNYADDEGRGIIDHRLLKAAIWPLDDDIQVIDVISHVVQLVDSGLIQVYEVAGRTYFQVTNWKEHQSISKPRPSRFPEPSRNVPGALPEASSREGKGREQGRERNGKEVPPPSAEDNNPFQPTHDQLYLVEKLFDRFSEELSPGAIVKLNKVHGRANVESAMRELHGFPPEDKIRSLYAYVDSIAGGVR